MHRIIYQFGLPGAIILGDHYAGAAGQTNEEADQQVDDRTGAAAHGGERFFTDETAHDHGIRRIVELLEKRPK